MNMRKVNNSIIKNHQEHKQELDRKINKTGNRRKARRKKVMTFVTQEMRVRNVRLNPHLSDGQK